MPVVLLIIVILALVIIISNISVVQQSRAYVVERLGAFHSVWGVGMHFKVPFIDRVARKVSLKEQVLDYPPQPVITKDNVTMQIDTVVYFQITDPKLYCYGVEQPMMAMETLTATTLRNIIGDLDDQISVVFFKLADSAFFPAVLIFSYDNRMSVLPQIQYTFIKIGRAHV